jgi:acetone carboxylase gamma subunit
MIYIKIEDVNGKITIIPLYSDEFYTICPECGIEQKVNAEAVAQILINDDLPYTNIFCRACSASKMNNK